MLTRTLVLWAVVIGVLILFTVQPALAQTTTPAPGSITGTVTYRQRSALPPNSVVTVRLVDVSRADAPATVLAEQQIAATGQQPPIPFTISYDPAKIDPRNSYAVQATISTYNQVRFRNTTRYSVLTQGQPATADIVVEAIAGQLPDTSGGDKLPIIAMLLGIAAAGIALIRRVGGARGEPAA